MASNNQRAPSAPLPPRWSNESKKNSKEQQQQILSQLKEMFDSILEPEIILSVVQNCQWKLQPSINALNMLSESTETPINRIGQNVGWPGMPPTSNFTPKNINTEGQSKNENMDKIDYKSNVEYDTSFLHLNDQELLRQQEESRKFELLKKDLAEKGFAYSGDNENVSKPMYSTENNKIPAPKLQQFGHLWSTLRAPEKQEPSKVYFCSDVESNSTGGIQINSTMNQLWMPNSAEEERKANRYQFNNLFGRKSQLSRDFPLHKLSNKGIIPKNSKTQTSQCSSPQQKNIDPAIITSRNASALPSKNLNGIASPNTQPTEENPKGFQFNQYDRCSFNSAEYNLKNFRQDIGESHQPPDVVQQQVTQFDSNYDIETKTRTTGSKTNSHKGEMESLCGLKVQYRLPGLENSSDDDADVVIEEETTDYPTQIPSLVSANVCQFISSSAPNTPDDKRPKIRPANRPSSPKSPQCNTYDNTLKKIIASIVQGHKVLIILRGLPGSGKSHLATNIVKSSVGGDPNQFIFSVNDFFVMLGGGVCQYAHSKLMDAHNYTQKRVCNALKEGVSPVILSNTNTQAWEMQPYVVMGVQNGYLIEVLEPNTPWCRNINELVKKSTQGVLKDTIKQMMDRYECNITSAKLIERFALSYSLDNIPPQPRKFPPLGPTSSEPQEIHTIRYEKQKSKRNRRRKKNLNSNLESSNCLLSDSDKNMKHAENSLKSNSGDGNTLQNIVSNALMSENDTLNKSLVDYCIETDSGDDLDPDRVPAQEKNGATHNLLGTSETDQSFSTFENEGGTPSPIISDPLKVQSSSKLRNTKKITNNSQQNLGAIGSERKGSVTAIDCVSPTMEKRENKQDNVENVLSQCWDFTMLVNGRQIHSTSHYPKVKHDLPGTNKPQKPTPDIPTGVIITEIQDDEFGTSPKKSTVLEEPMNEEMPVEDPDTIMSNIINKMDASEMEATPCYENIAVDKDVPTESNHTESEQSFETERKASESVSSIGSIFSMIKKSLLGRGSESKQAPTQNVRSEESMMKFKRQTNDNSLSENDAYENEMAHREPSAFVVIDKKDKKDEGFSEVEISTTTIDDSLSTKLSRNSSTALPTDVEQDSCRISNSVSYGTLETDAAEYLVDDNLSKKLLEDEEMADKIASISSSNPEALLISKTQNQTRNPCINASIDSDDVLIKNSEEKLEDVGNNISESISACLKSNQTTPTKDLIDADTEKLEIVNVVVEPNTNCKLIGENPEEKVMGVLSNQSQRTEHILPLYDILSDAVNRLIIPEMQEKQLVDDNISELSFPEEEANTIQQVPVFDGCNNEEESKFQVADEKTQASQNLSLDSNTVEKTLRDSEIISEDESSMEQCCEDCDSTGCRTPAEWLQGENSVDLSTEKNQDPSPQLIVDNMNQVTWKQSPFPIDDITLGLISNEIPPVVSKIDSCTNTSNYDFNVLYVGGTSEQEYKVLSTQSRTINSNSSLVLEEKPPLKLMLDKSSMTSVVDILSGEESLEVRTEVETMKDLAELIEMFSNIPSEDITEVYKNLCSSDFNWAVDVLLDGVPEHVTRYTKIDSPKINIEKRTSTSEAKDTESENFTSSKERLDRSKQQSGSLELHDGDSKSQQQNFSPRKKRDKHRVSEEILELKRQIEEKMVINEASYNPHILRVKRWKNGKPDIAVEENAETRTKNTIEFSSQLSVDYEENACETQSPKTSDSADDFTEDDIEPEEMMELNLGQNFIKNLETEFGDSDFQFPDGLFPVIQIKKSMAQQLHALWIESMEQQLHAQQEQLDKMIEKDAEYARSLEQEEAQHCVEPVVPNLSEIMDMELALAIYNNDLKNRQKLETSNDLASRLTRKMLHEMFIDHDPETLDEILNAHNGNFKETLDILEASTGRVVDRNNTLQKQKNLIDRAKKESAQSVEVEMHLRASVFAAKDTDLNYSGSSDLSPITYEAALEEAHASRKDAQHHLSLRNENFNKATDAFRKGNREVAAYYSQMAKLHSRKMEYANATAANAFLTAQDYVMNTDNTLDLHYLYVTEALQALEVFLDHQISRLNGGNKKTKHLYIITGRGARSNRGLSRLKPAISKKLASKNIRFTEENPGCLKAVIHRRSNTGG
ncbi:uncharacterized protein LOC105689669 [Athalia rosae]|uniref:uncharacterized protein LOC105689669 n=1 Tax=Athalia rosae TaxID=37344 RepID=UPI002033C132|nr:uncharacterized protein LOC105689669 [Athalia rosae]XP_048514369.1 uncharacterized protein LOC105689669 [Athalia rosae]